MKLPAKIATGVVCVALIACMCALLSPLPSYVDNWIFRRELARTLILSFTYMGAGALFIASLKTYKTKVRHALTTLSAGILLLAIAMLQIPFAQAFALQDSFWAKSGLIQLPFLLSVLVIYAGVRSFARLAGYTGILSKAPLVIIVIITLSVLSAYLPHSSSPPSELELDATNILLVWTGLLNLTSSIIIFKIRQQIGAHYASAIAWLWAALVGSLFVVAFTLLNGLFTTDTASVLITLANISAIIVGIFYLRAGYVFTQTEDY